MNATDDTTATLEALTSFRLANEAGCSCPDSIDSAGGRFLDLVRDSIAGHLEECDDGGHSDCVAELVDGCVPIYTRDVWAMFVDLGAYNEDPSELGADGSDMEQSAKVCLYMIAERLAYRLLELGAVDHR